jgi:inosine/xanthosine triphosphate pyrophosphatase family protein
MGFFRDELGKTYDELSVGQKAAFSRRVTKQDVLQT